MQWIKGLPKEEVSIAVNASDVIFQADKWHGLSKTQSWCVIDDELLHVGVFGLQGVPVKRFNELVEFMVGMAERYGVRRVESTSETGTFGKSTRSVFLTSE